MKSIIQLEGVDFFYDKGKPTEVHALADINLRIESGDYVSFFGPSGCGKSTLLYTIAGIERPDHGKVSINGEDILTFSQQELAVYRQVGIGIVFQTFNLIPSIKNIDNVTLPMAFLGISSDRRQKRAKEIFERLDIADLADRYPFELSGGQQQRVGIARAIANDPPIILADEPIGNLDSVNANNVLDLLNEFNQRDGKTIIMVTHEAWSLKDVHKIFYMRDGKIIKTEEKERKKGAMSRAEDEYKKLYPELPPLEIRAKALSNLLLRGYSREEMERLERFLVERFQGKIGKEGLRTLLDLSYKEGGVGLWKQRAVKIANFVEEVLNEEAKIENVYKKLEKSPETPLAKDINDFRRWLLNDIINKDVDSLRLERLDELIEERIRNIITGSHFKRVLNLPKTKGGLGLRISTSMRLADKLEALLGKEEKEENVTVS